METAKIMQIIKKKHLLIQKILKKAFFFVLMQTISKITTNFAKICGHGDCMFLMRTILIYEHNKPQ